MVLQWGQGSQMKPARVRGQPGRTAAHDMVCSLPSITSRRWMCASRLASAVCKRAGRPAGKDSTPERAAARGAACRGATSAGSASMHNGTHTLHHPLKSPSAPPGMHPQQPAVPAGQVGEPGRSGPAVTRSQRQHEQAEVSAGPGQGAAPNGPAPEALSRRWQRTCSSWMSALRSASSSRWRSAHIWLWSCNPTRRDLSRQ